MRTSLAGVVNPSSDFSWQPKLSISMGDRVFADVGRSDSWRARDGLTSSRDRRGRDEHTSAQPSKV